MSFANNKLAGNFPKALIKSSDSFAPILDFVSALSACFVITLIEIFLHVDFTGGDQEFLPINGSNFLSPPLIPTLGNHIVKNLLKIMNLYKKIPKTVRTFAQGLISVLVL